MKKIGWWWKDESGATSVLVIFMMIVLVTLGALAIVSANVNYKFSVHALDWNREYFLMDGKAETYVMDVDLCLADAEKKAVDYILSAGYNAKEYEGIHSDVQTAFYTLCQQNTSDKSVPLQYVMDGIYWYYVEQNLNQLTEQYPEQKILSLYNRDLVSGMTVSTLIRAEDGSEAGLNVGLRINPIAIKLQYINNQVTGAKEADWSRYEIQQWREYQKEFEQTDSFEVWDGNMGGENPYFNGEDIFHVD